MHVCYQCRTEWEAEGVPTEKDLCPTCSPEFKEFKKIPRLSREIVITEKIDGTNGLIYIDEVNNIFAGSRNRWLDEHTDNHNFWHWVMGNKEELLKLGKGYHYGEWWGKEIQRGYNLQEKRFSLFDTGKWIKREKNIKLDFPTDAIINIPVLKEKQEYCPECCYVVPILYEGMFDTEMIQAILDGLRIGGSRAVAPQSFMKPEGIIIYHKAGNYYFKKTIENDEKGKTNE
jgi:hypothetical protein